MVKRTSFCFRQQFFGSKEDINLLDKLTTKEEISGLFHVLLKRLPRVLENGVRKATNEVMQGTHDKYVICANPVKYFVEKALILDSTARVKKLDMYDAYERFCQEYGLPVESEQSFSRKMTRGLGYEVKQGRENGERYYFYIEVKIMDWKQKEIEEQSRLEDINLLLK